MYVSENSGTVFRRCTRLCCTWTHEFLWTKESVDYKFLCHWECKCARFNLLMTLLTHQTCPIGFYATICPYSVIVFKLASGLLGHRVQKAVAMKRQSPYLTSMLVALLAGPGPIHLLLLRKDQAASWSRLGTELLAWRQADWLLRVPSMNWSSLKCLYQSVRSKTLHQLSHSVSLGYDVDVLFKHHIHRLLSECKVPAVLSKIESS